MFNQFPPLLLITNGVVLRPLYYPRYHQLIVTVIEKTVTRFWVESGEEGGSLPTFPLLPPPPPATPSTPRRHVKTLLVIRLAKQNSPRASRLFVHFTLLSLQEHDVKLPGFTFHEGANTRQLFLNRNTVLWNLTPEKVTNILDSFNNLNMEYKSDKFWNSVNSRYQRRFPLHPRRRCF